MIELAMRFGKTPSEFLALTDSAEIAELLAYFSLMREGAKPKRDVESSLRGIFGNPNARSDDD